MTRTVYDDGDAHVRLQAPEGWVQVERRGVRIVLRHPDCPTPLFVEPLPGVEDLDRYILALLTRKIRIGRDQQCMFPAGRRFVLTMTTREGTIERGCQIQRVVSSRGKPVWVLASIDLDGDSGRRRLLAEVFPGVDRAPNISDGSGLRQYVEQPPQAVAGWQAGPGFTLKLPRGFAVAEASGDRFLLREGDASFAWLTVRRIGADAAVVSETLDELRERRGATVDELSAGARLALAQEDSTLWVPVDGIGHLVFSLDRTGDRSGIEQFFRRMLRELRLWTGGFAGYWTRPHSMTWADVRPAPPPAPAPVRPAPPSQPPPSPPADLKAEWEARLADTALFYKAGPVSSGYDRSFSFFSGERTVTIWLDRGGGAKWMETGFLSSSVPGLPSFGPGEYRKERRGTWQVLATATTAHLTLDFGRDGFERLRLGLSATGVTLDGVPYTLTRM